MTNSINLQRAIADARALLDAMSGSDLARLHVSLGGIEIFLSRHAEPSPLAWGGTPRDVAVSALAVEHRISAPHVATLVSVVAVGDRIDAGQPVAIVAVLDQQQEVCSPVSGRVANVSTDAGDLIEYGQTLMMIEAAA